MPEIHPAGAAATGRRASGSIDIAIIGGGAAGLMTAIWAARRAPAARVVVFDGASRLGAKILASGGGRCNITNRHVAGSDYRGGDRHVVDSVLRAWPAAETVAFFRQLGVTVHEEEDGKMFPDSNRARTVLDALVGEAARRGVETRRGQRVGDLRVRPGGFLLGIEGQPVEAARVVLATGGSSLPATGSDGFGVRLAARLGHAVVPQTPALVPLVLGGSFHRELAGVSHPAALRVQAEGARATTLRGLLLWTHFGISGPVALDASRYWHRADADGRHATVRLSFLPGLQLDEVDRRLAGTAEERSSLGLRRLLAGLVPSAVADALLDRAGIARATRLSQFARDDRRRLACALVECELPVVGSRGYEHAEVTAGGVSLADVDRGTMESKRHAGLHFAGEMLDVDGRLGGFNFQWAWSSAWVAARGATQGMTA